MPTPSKQRLRKLLKAMKRHFGDESVQCLGDETARPIPRIPSGSIGVDRVLGGGLPVGRVMEVFGRESSGKTTLCLHAVAEAQRLDKLVAFVDAEHALDPRYAQRIGVDLSSLIVSQPDSGEQALAIVQALVSSGDVSLIVVDSVAALTPRAELEGEMGAQHMGLQARMMAQALRKLTALCHRNECTILFINQIRQKIGVVFGSPETTPGGNALKFFSSVRLETRRVGSVKQGDDIVGMKLRVRGVKNKVGPPFRDTVLELYFDHGVHRGIEMLDLGLAGHVVERAGNWYAFGDQRLGQGRERSGAFLLENPEVATALLAALPPLNGDDAGGAPGIAAKENPRSLDPAPAASAA